ncbi:MAG: DUF1415 domain-containing protein [Bacteroidetes bacterium]|nr:DUF1415 domain-containing protein [Bacteroidota bacterium]MCB0853241.1 DUF1415 domain-containing protein [Bacteroidota bacterium]
MVIGLNLCPFATGVFRKGQVKFVVSEATDDEMLLADLVKEIDYLVNTSPETTDTTLLIHPHVMSNFEDYIDFLDIAEAVIEEAELEGIIQIASFHPDYQFFGTEKDDVTNYTNRSPYPILHLLREESLSKAIDSHPDPEGIPEKNIELMERLGLEKVKDLQKSGLIDES